MRLEDFFERRPAVRHHAQQQVFGARILVAQLRRLGLRGIEGFLERLAQERVGGGGSLHFRAARKLLFDLARERGRRRAELLEQRPDESFGLFEQRQQEMLAIDLLVRIPAGDGLRGLQGFLRLDGESIHLHGLTDKRLIADVKWRLSSFGQVRQILAR